MHSIHRNTSPQQFVYRILFLVVFLPGCDIPLWGPDSRLVSSISSEALPLQWLILGMAFIELLLTFFFSWDSFPKSSGTWERLRANLEDRQRKQTENLQGAKPPTAEGKLLETILPEQGGYLEYQSTRISARAGQLFYNILPNSKQQQYLSLVIFLSLLQVVLAWSGLGGLMVYLLEVSSSVSGLAGLWLLLWLLLGLSTQGILRSATVFLLTLFFLYQNTSLLFYWLFPYCFAQLLRLILSRFDGSTSRK
jgi:hypothetical protein